MVSTRTMSSAGPSRSLRHHTVVPAHDLNKSYGFFQLNLMHLPREILEHMLSFLPHSTIGVLRQVCQDMDHICGGILNRKFSKLQTDMLTRFQRIKSLMPRRESARRNHPLACESDIIETLHMRLTLLQMTFGKHIERKHICFFAGEILDEVHRILHYIRVTPKLGRPYKVTDELFDLSTMAVEYFKEHVEPTLPDFGLMLHYPDEWPDLSGFDETTPASISTSSKSEDTSVSGLPQSNMVLRKRIRRIKQGMKRYNNQLMVLRRDLRAFKGKIADQQKQIHEYSSRLDDCDKKNEEASRKFSTVVQELNKCKTELQFWRSKAPVSFCWSCGNPCIPGGQDDILPVLELVDDNLAGPSNAGQPDDSKAGVSKEMDLEVSARKVKTATPKRKTDDTSSQNPQPKKSAKRVLKPRRK